MRKLLASAALAALAACGPNQHAETGASAPAAAPVAGLDQDGRSEKAAGEAAPADAPQSEDKPQQPKQPAAQAPAGVMLAYSYAYGIEAPAKQVTPLMKAHEAECAAAGSALCQMLGSSTNSLGENDMRGELQLRGEPRWLAAFRAKLEGDAKAAGGKLASATTTSEDLTRSIVDSEAHLRAQTTLRDRLQGLLASRPGKLSDLLDVERELARVQGEIDATQSELAVMKQRVSMSTLTIDYSSSGAPLTDTTFAPIKDAVVKFARTIAEGIAAMITLTAMLLPWIGLGWLLLWLFGLWRKRRRAGKAAGRASFEATFGEPPSAAG